MMIVNDILTIINDCFTFARQYLFWPTIGLMITFHFISNNTSFLKSLSYRTMNWLSSFFSSSSSSNTTTTAALDGDRLMDLRRVRELQQQEITIKAKIAQKERQIKQAAEKKRKNELSLIKWKKGGHILGNGRQPSQSQPQPDDDHDSDNNNNDDDQDNNNVNNDNNDNATKIKKKKKSSSSSSRTSNNRLRGDYNPMQPWSSSSGGGGYRPARRVVNRG